MTGVDWGLAGKSIIVTGASSGIGAQVVRALGSVGASPVLVGRDLERLQAEAAKVMELGGKAHTVIAEASRHTSMEPRSSPMVAGSRSSGAGAAGA